MKVAVWSLAGLVCSAYICVCAATEVVAVGSAPIRDGDIGQARELAIRRAVARAAESQSATVISRSVAMAGSVQESTQLRTNACTGRTELIKESASNQELTVTLQVNVLSPGDCPPACQTSYVNKIVITDFGFEFPEQLFPTEREHLKYRIAGELARSIRKGQRLLVDFDAMVFPYVSPASAPQPFMRTGESETPFARLARTHRGQYVLSGVYRDMGLRLDRWNKPLRRLEVEAFLHDGANGTVLDRRTFAAEMAAAAILADNMPLGSTAFYQSDFGKVWGSVINSIARWAEEKVTCLPFVSRVIKTEGDTV